MKAIRFPLAVVALVMCGAVLGVVFAAEEGEESKSKYTIKEVMTNNHKDGLLKKVLEGESSQTDKLTLLDHYISLVENTPPKGDMESWQTLAGKVALAAAKVAVGREDATAELKAATNCVACHKVHKESE